MNTMSRRTFLVSGGILAGFTLSSIGLRAVAAANVYQANESSVFLNESLRTSLAVITDMIIPATDTPGANGAGVPAFIEHMLANCLSFQEAEDWLSSFNLFLDSTDFTSLSKLQQRGEVQNLDARLGQDAFYSLIKELTIIGYYTSEIGGSIELKYDPVPGPYREIPLKSLERAWS